jgi:hypothetical protein
MELIVRNPLPASHSLVPKNTELLASQLDYFLVDGSGSMQDKWWESLAAMDAYMKVLRAQNIDSHGIATVFSGQDLQMIQRDSKIADWKPFYEEPLGSTWSTTPLYDAINAMARHLRDLDPPRATIIIVTDGEEASSRHTTADQARSLLDWCRAKGWQVVFLGADFNNSRQAKLLGANDSNSIGVQKRLLEDAGTVLARKRMIYGATGDEINFSQEEKQQFGGYLSAPDGAK